MHRHWAQFLVASLFGANVETSGSKTHSDHFKSFLKHEAMMMEMRKDLGKRSIQNVEIFIQLSWIDWLNIVTRHFG
jgi:hypothetical protein